MNKRLFVFASFIFCVFIIFSCTLPTAVELKMYPRMAFAAKKDISALFSEAVRDGFESKRNGVVATNLDFYECTKTFTQTFLVSLKYKITIPVATITNGFTVSSGINVSIPIGTDVDIGSGVFTEIELNQLSDFFDGFHFVAIKAALRAKDDSVHSSFQEVIKLFHITLTDLNQPVGSQEIGGGRLNPIADLEAALHVVPGEKKVEITTLPNDGINLNDGAISGLFDISSADPLKLGYNVKLLAGTTIESSVLTGLTDSSYDMTVEFLVWIPLVLEADPLNGAILEFPEMFDSNDDIFGRDDPTEENEMLDALHNARFFMRLNNPLFNDYTASIKMANFSPPSLVPLKGNELLLVLTNENINFIKTAKFAPEVSIIFNPRSRLTIPRNLMIVEIGLDADIVYRQKL